MSITLEKNYYSDIKDFPLYNWRECQAGKLNFARKKMSVGNEDMDSESWDAIYDSYIKVFGLGKELQTYLRKVDQVTRMLLEYAETGDRFLMNEINLIQSEIDQLNVEKKGGSSLDVAVVNMSKWMGGGFIEERKVTVSQFYTAYNEMLKDYERKNKQGRTNR